MSTSKICPVYVKIKNCCSAKDTVRKTKEQATDWEEMCAKTHVQKKHPKHTKNS